MGNACGSSKFSNTLVQKYGEDTIRNYMTASFGQALVTQQFGQTKKMITDRYNASGQAQTNPAVLNNIINQVNAVQLQQMQKVSRGKPSIPELDGMSTIKKQKLMNRFNERYETEIFNYRNSMVMNLAGSVDPNRYIAGQF